MARRSSKISNAPRASIIHLIEPVNAIGPSDRANKIRIVLDGLRGEDSIAELRRRESHTISGQPRLVFVVKDV